jgi:AcrR family transcriptional regulator
MESNHRRLSRITWLKAARNELTRHGIGSVTINTLAKQLKVTRESFYWHFKSRAALLDELLSDWEKTNNAPFERTLNLSGDGLNEFRTIAHDIWITEKGYSPKFDTAMRDWGRSSRKVALSVKRVDERRIEILRKIFLDLGYQEPEAMVRARVAYFHQVGYYTIGMRETKKSRLELLPYYMSILSGIPIEQLRKISFAGSK